MPCYVIVEIDIHDPETFAGYAAHSHETLAPFGGRYLARGVTPEVLEGEWAPPRLTILEFPDAASARGWYESDAYQELKAIRQRAANTDAVLVDGVVPS
jgi:uncharacterized protein (DUF1330 family)